MSIIKAWLNKDKIAEVNITNPNGGNITLKKASAEDVATIAKAVKFKMDND